jgi:DNA-binding transcriptional MerR regulator
VPKRNPEKVQGRIYVKELAQSIDRTQHTIRQWEKARILPRRALPMRDERGWRYWTPEQVDLIVAWLERRRPQSAGKLIKLRSRRRREEDEEE